MQKAGEVRRLWGQSSARLNKCPAGRGWVARKGEPSARARHRNVRQRTARRRKMQNATTTAMSAYHACPTAQTNTMRTTTTQKCSVQRNNEPVGNKHGTGRYVAAGKRRNLIRKGKGNKASGMFGTYQHSLNQPQEEEPRDCFAVTRYTAAR